MKTYLWGLAFLFLAISCYCVMWAMEIAMLYNARCTDDECIRITTEWMYWPMSGLLLSLLAALLSIYFALRKPKKKAEKEVPVGRDDKVFK